MSRSPWVWLDGRYLREKDAKIPASDPGLLYGHGVFESLRVYDGEPFRLKDHLERMRASAQHFGVPFRRARGTDRVVRELCRRNRLRNAYVRLTLSKGGHLLVLARRLDPIPAPWYEKGAEVTIAPWRRDPNALLVGYKTLNYLENVLTYKEARRQGCADALYVGPRGELLEGCVSNIFLVQGEKIVTPSLKRKILPGITRKVVMELVRVRQRRVHVRELWTSDEIFLTNSLVEILPVIKPPGPVTRRIAGAYRLLSRGRKEKS